MMRKSLQSGSLGMTALCLLALALLQRDGRAQDAGSQGAACVAHVTVTACPSTEATTEMCGKRRSCTYGIAASNPNSCKIEANRSFCPGSKDKNVQSKVVRLMWHQENLGDNFCKDTTYKCPPVAGQGCSDGPSGTYQASCTKCSVNHRIGKAGKLFGTCKKKDGSFVEASLLLEQSTTPITNCDGQLRYGACP